MCGYSMSNTGFEINPARRARVSRCFERRRLEKMLPRRGLPHATDASRANIVPLRSCNPGINNTHRHFFLCCMDQYIC